MCLRFMTTSEKAYIIHNNKTNTRAYMDISLKTLQRHCSIDGYYVEKTDTVISCTVPEDGLMTILRGFDAGDFHTILC